MGCSSSQQSEPSGVSSNNCRVFKVALLNSQGEESCSGQLEVTFQDLVLHQKGKDPTRWPLWSLRRYGCDKDLFLFESGRRCPSGPGSFAFRCQQAEALFNLLHLSVVWTGQAQNNRLSTIDELNPSVQATALNEFCQEFQASENLLLTNNAVPNYINDPAQFKYYNVLGHWRDDVCRAINYAHLDLSPNEGDDLTEDGMVANRHSYINVGNKEQRVPYVNVGVTAGNGRPYMNVPSDLRKPFSVPLPMSGRSQRPRSLEWYRQSFHGCTFEDSGYLNPRKDLSVRHELKFHASSLNHVAKSGAGDRRSLAFHPSCEMSRRNDDRAGYAAIDFDKTLAFGSAKQRSTFDDRMRKTRHSCEIETMYHC